MTNKWTDIERNGMRAIEELREVNPTRGGEKVERDKGVNGVNKIRRLPVAARTVY